MSDREERKRHYVEWRLDTAARNMVVEGSDEERRHATIITSRAAAEFDEFDPPPAPPLPRCHYCGGEQERETMAACLFCKSCRRRWYSRIGPVPTDAQLAAEYERPVRLAEARGRVEAVDEVRIQAGGNPISCDRVRLVENRYRAELARLESEGGPA